MRKSDIFGIYLITSTLFYFLIFAQFGFLEVHPIISPTHLIRIMSLMGMGGMTGCLWLYIKKISRPMPLLRKSTIFCAFLSIMCLYSSNMWIQGLISFGIGLNLSIITIITSYILPDFLTQERYATKIGLGVGFAYFIANIPPIFNATAELQTIITSSTLTISSLIITLQKNIVPVKNREKIKTHLIPEPMYQPPYFGLFLTGLFILVSVDSNVFYIIQHTFELKNISWGNNLQLSVIGFSHLLGAYISGTLIDNQKGMMVIPITVILFYLAFLYLPESHEINFPTIAYATGISLYSVLLIGAASFSPITINSAETIKRRACIIFAICGWVGSGIGVSLGENSHAINEFIFTVLLVGLVTSLFILSLLRERKGIKLLNTQRA